MITQRQVKRADLLHWFAATALMVIAVMNADRWFWIVGAAASYFAVTIAEAIVHGGLSIRLLASEADDR